MATTSDMMLGQWFHSNSEKVLSATDPFSMLPAVISPGVLLASLHWTWPCLAGENQQDHWSIRYDFRLCFKVDARTTVLNLFSQVTPPQHIWIWQDPQLTTTVGAASNYLTHSQLGINRCKCPAHLLHSQSRKDCGTCVLSCLIIVLW